MPRDTMSAEERYQTVIELGVPDRVSVGLTFVDGSESGVTGVSAEN